MTKDKKIYAAPVMQMQVFVPNAYMRQCLAGQKFGVKCIVGGEDISKAEGMSHGTDSGCGLSSSQSLSFDSGSNLWTFKENSTTSGPGGQSDLGTAILTDAVGSLTKNDDLSYNNLTSKYGRAGIPYSEVGQYQTKLLYWITYRPGNTDVIWHHKGYVVDYKTTEKNLS